MAGSRCLNYSLAICLSPEPEPFTNGGAGEIKRNRSRTVLLWLRTKPTVSAFGMRKVVLRGLGVAQMQILGQVL